MRMKNQVEKRNASRLVIEWSSGLPYVQLYTQRRHNRSAASRFLDIEAEVSDEDEEDEDEEELGAGTKLD